MSNTNSLVDKEGGFDEDDGDGGDDDFGKLLLHKLTQ